MSNAIIKQDGVGSVVADNFWEVRLGPAAFLLGLLTGAGLVLVLVRRPSRQVPTPTGWPINFAHRGGAAMVPENTLEGFEEAVGVGDVVLELDAQTSADATVVVFHDTTVDETTDGHGRVAELTCAELQRLDAAYNLPRRSTERGRWRGQGRRIPTLEAVYRKFPEHSVVIELKGDRPGTEKAVWAVIEAANAQGRTLVATNGTASIRRFRRLSDGSVATAASVREFAVFKALGFLHLQRLYRLPYQALQPPEFYKGIRVVTPALVRRAHDAGLRVDVWTVNDEADMRRLLSWGVDGIMTDHPDVLAGLLDATERRL